MAGKKRVSFTLAEDDYVNTDLREEFSHIAKSSGMPIGVLLSRAFYLVCAEHHEHRMEGMLNQMRQEPRDPSKPLKEEMVADSEAWEQYKTDCSWQETEMYAERQRQRSLEK